MVFLPAYDSVKISRVSEIESIFCIDLNLTEAPCQVQMGAMLPTKGHEASILSE